MFSFSKNIFIADSKSFANPDSRYHYSIILYISSKN